jgi:hypothetical protein
MKDLLSPEEHSESEFYPPFKTPPGEPGQIDLTIDFDQL